MKLTIWSHWNDEQWTGEIPIPEDTTTVEATLEYVFRFFNRVEDGDHERMEDVGYMLPSLSVDDHVDLHDQGRWRVAPAGWDLLCGSRA